MWHVRKHTWHPLHRRPGPVFRQCFYLRPQSRRGITLFIGFRSRTLGALEQVLSLLFTRGLMGICLGTSPEPWGEGFTVVFGHLKDKKHFKWTGVLLQLKSKVLKSVRWPTTCAALKFNCIYSMNILKLLNNWKQLDVVSWRLTLSVKSHLSSKTAERRLLTREGGRTFDAPAQQWYTSALTFKVRS